MKKTFVALVASSALFCGGTAQAQVLGFGSAPQGSIGYNMSSAIAKVMAETESVTRAFEETGAYRLLLEGAGTSVEELREVMATRTTFLVSHRVSTVKGADLVGLRYAGPFDDLPVQRSVEHRVDLGGGVGRPPRLRPGAEIRHNMARGRSSPPRPTRLRRTHPRRRGSLRRS